MKVFLIILLVFASMIVSYIIGRRSALHSYSEKMINEALVGTLVVDMSGVEKDLFQIELDKNPKEFMHLNYIMMDVKIRQ